MIDRATLLRLSDEINNLFMKELCGTFTEDQVMIDQAVNTLIELMGKGGSSRAYAEGRVVNLIERFDDTRDETNAWPLSKFMIERASDLHRQHLTAVVQAYRNGSLSMIKAIEAAERTLDQ